MAKPDESGASHVADLADAVRSARRAVRRRPDLLFDSSSWASEHREALVEGLRSGLIRTRGLAEPPAGPDTRERWALVTLVAAHTPPGAWSFNDPGLRREVPPHARPLTSPSSYARAIQGALGIAARDAANAMDEDGGAAVWLLVRRCPEYLEHADRFPELIKTFGQLVTSGKLRVYPVTERLRPGSTAG